jgi:hypothetical protein
MGYLGAWGIMRPEGAKFATIQDGVVSGFGLDEATKRVLDVVAATMGPDMADVVRPNEPRRAAPQSSRPSSITSAGIKLVLPASQSRDLRYREVHRTHRGTHATEIPKRACLTAAFELVSARKNLVSGNVGLLDQGERSRTKIRTRANEGYFRRPKIDLSPRKTSKSCGSSSMPV